MQVHKEAIDKVPNSLPNRSNIEVEIYGMEGIPAADLKEHEKQKNGNRSESDDDEPVTKKAKPEGGGMMGMVATPQQNMVMTNMMAPHMMGQFGPMGMMPMGPMPPYMGAPPGMQMFPPHMQQRPLFPAAATSTVASSAAQAKPTFPAYSSSATISAPPTTNNSTGVGGVPGAPPAGPPQIPIGEPPKSIIAATNTASKIIHPPEADVSLEEIRARNPKYQRQRATPTATSSAAASVAYTSTANHYTTSSIAQSHHQTPTQVAVSAAQEVSVVTYLSSCDYSIDYFLFPFV